MKAYHFTEEESIAQHAQEHTRSVKELTPGPGVVVHAFNPSHLEAQIWRITIGGQCRQKLARPHLNQ
jgi:hypothetical protein